MAYIINRKDRFYVVDYDGIDAVTGRERRRWRSAGASRADAEALAARLEGDRANALASRTPTAFGGFLLETWLPRKQTTVRATTASRYRWMAEHYVDPRLGHVPLSALRADHFDRLYSDLLLTGGRNGRALSPKTVHEVHLIIRNALDLATQRRLVDHNVARAVHSPIRRRGGTIVARVWTVEELARFLTEASGHRLYPALHLAAHTGMRRGEVVGLRWSDLDVAAARLSIHRTIQALDGRPVEFGAKTRSSRRNIDLDPTTVEVLDAWRRRLKASGLPHGPGDWMFCNLAGRYLNPQSVSQLFGRVVKRIGLPRIRLHDLRHTHASVLVAHDTPIKVVTERLGHAHPAFTMHTYQHLLPGMSAAAATRFASLVAAAGR